MSSLSRCYRCVQINWLALLFVIVLTVWLLLGSGESALIQNMTMGVYLSLICFVVICGATRSTTPTTPHLLPMVPA